MDHEMLTRLWHQYRDEERERFQSYWVLSTECEVLWEDYKAMFQRFPNFPDWLWDNGHLEQAEDDVENRRSIVDALESAPHIAWDIAQISAKALVPPGLTRVILGELEKEDRVTVEAGAGRPRWRVSSGARPTPPRPLGTEGR